MAQNPEFVDSWASMTATPPAVRPSLAGACEADVVVVGGGFAGLHTAQALAARGQSVVLLERGRLAGKASGANAGMVEAGFFVDFDALTEQVGAADARRLFGLSQTGVQRLRGLIQQTGRRDLLQCVGALTVSRQEQGPDFAANILRQADQTGAVLTPMSTEEVRAQVGSHRYFQGFRDPLAFQVQPLRLAYALAGLAESKGALIFENAPVLAVRRKKAGFQIRTDDGMVTARSVVLAGGATLGGLNWRVRRSLIPIAASMGMTEPLGARLAECLPFQGAVTDDRWLPDYFRAIEGGRLIWGRRVSRVWLGEPMFHKYKLARDIADVFPALKGVRIDRSWAGTMVSAPGNMPQIAEIKPGLWVLSGLGGLGMAWSTIGGELIASAIAEGDRRHEVLKPFAPRWSGSWAGRLKGQYRLWSARYTDWDRDVRG